MNAQQAVDAFKPVSTCWMLLDELVAVIGAAVAITIFLLEKKIIENKGKPESKEEEEFF